MESNTVSGAARQDTPIGRDVARRVKGQPPRVRAEIGADLVAAGWLPAQASRIVVCHPVYISQAIRQRKNGNGHAINDHADIDQIIKNFGWATLDRLTAPATANPNDNT